MLDSNKLPVNIPALETAVTALIGEQGKKIIEQLYYIIDAAETRGYQRGEKDGFEAGSAALMNDVAYQRGYDDAVRDGAYTYDPDDFHYSFGDELPEVPEEDIREPMVNATVEGERYPDMSEYHVRPIPRVNMTREQIAEEYPTA